MCENDDPRIHNPCPRNLVLGHQFFPRRPGIAAHLKPGG